MHRTISDFGTCGPISKEGCSRSLGQRDTACKASRQLPNGTYWLSNEATKYDVVYGQNFVLQRPKRDGAGLTIARKDTKLSTQEASSSTELAVRRIDSRSGLINHSQSPWDVTDITDYTFLGDTGLLPGQRGPILLPALASSLHHAGAECTGIILHPSAQPITFQEDSQPDLHPRRTKKVRFTCKLCNTTSEKRVSPHGWHSGTVFARCEGCSVVHKLVDNLNIIHELKGAVFPRPVIKDLKIPPGLPQKPTLDYHVHPAIYKEFPEG